MGLVSIKYLEQQSKHSTKNTVAIIIITTIIIKHFREDKTWEETGTTHRPGQELWGMNKLVAGRPQNLPAAGSALMVGGAHLCGCGCRRAVQWNSLPPSTWRWRWALEGTIFLAGVHPPLQRCPVLRHHYPGQRGQRGRQKQDGMSGTLGVPTSAAGCVLLRHPTYCFRKESPS